MACILFGTRAVKLAVKGQPAKTVQPADFSSRLSGPKVVIKLNNNIISSFLIIAIMSNRSENII